MKLLVTTPLQIFLVDPFTGEKSIIRAGDGYYFGVTHKNGQIALSHSGGYLQLFHSSLSRPVQSQDHLIQPHQIEWVDDRILVANTGRNCLSVYDERANFLSDVFLNEIRWDDKDNKRRGNHFNSVHRMEDQIYIVAHNYSRPSEVWILSYPELKVVNTLVTEASWAHNVWQCEWGLLICNSKNRSLFDVETGKDIWQAGEQGTITRGLAASDEYIFIGQSNYAERKERYWKTGGVWVVDRKTLKTIDRIVLSGSGDVQEVRLLDEEDYCHNGYVMKSDDLMSIKRVSPLILLAYNLRKNNPYFQKSIFPVSQLVRAAQMSNRLLRSLQNKVYGLNSG